MEEPMCGNCKMWSKPMKVEKRGDNIYLLSCSNPNHSYAIYAEIAYYKFFRKVDVK